LLCDDVAYFCSVGCSKTATSYGEGNDLKYVTDNFTLEDAKREGYVVIEDGMLPSDKKHGRILLICLPRKYRVKSGLFTIIQSVIRPITTQSIMKV